MKTLETFCNELKTNATLRSALQAAIKAAKVDDFLKEHGVDATASQLMDKLQGLDLGGDALGAAANLLKDLPLKGLFH